MNRIVTTIFISLLLALLPATLDAKSTCLPNVLFRFRDDMRADMIAAHGNPHIKTPNLNKLVAEGFSFRGTTSSAATAARCASRAARC